MPQLEWAPCAVRRQHRAMERSGPSPRTATRENSRDQHLRLQAVGRWMEAQRKRTVAEKLAYAKVMRVQSRKMLASQVCAACGIDQRDGGVFAVRRGEHVILESNTRPLYVE